MPDDVESQMIALALGEASLDLRTLPCSSMEANIVADVSAWPNTQHHAYVYRYFSQNLKGVCGLYKLAFKMTESLQQSIDALVVAVPAACIIC